jgi:16S rRNA (guanine966-N2)-methyltransferase
MTPAGVEAYPDRVHIIAGEFRGRRLLAPEGDRTRPMLGRVREALFSTLGDLVEEAHVLDLFSGSGSLGLEALSRGASSVRFIERERRALSVLSANIDELGVSERAQIIRGDAFERDLWCPAEVEGAAQVSTTGAWAQLVFLDPPYPRLQSLAPRRAVLGATLVLHESVLCTGGVLVLHTHPRDVDRDEFPTELDIEQRVYGNTALWYLWKPSVRASEGQE